MKHMKHIKPIGHIIFTTLFLFVSVTDTRRDCLALLDKTEPSEIIEPAAKEETPEPPFAIGKIPVTSEARFTAPAEAAAVINPLAFTVMFALVKDPTPAFTVAKVAATEPGPLAVISPVKSVIAARGVSQDGKPPLTVNTWPKVPIAKASGFKEPSL